MTHWTDCATCWSEDEHEQGCPALRVSVADIKTLLAAVGRRDPGRDTALAYQRVSEEVAAFERRQVPWHSEATP